MSSALATHGSWRTRQARGHTTRVLGDPPCVTVTVPLAQQ
jgi:hypothetical protein